MVICEARQAGTLYEDWRFMGHALLATVHRAIHAMTSLQHKTVTVNRYLTTIVTNAMLSDILL
jgi:hypothetical protein